MKTHRTKTETERAQEAEALSVGDKCIMRSPHSGEALIVDYRGRLGDKAVVVLESGYQIEIPTEWLSKN